MMILKEYGTMMTATATRYYSIDPLQLSYLFQMSACAAAAVGDSTFCTDETFSVGTIIPLF